MSKFSSSKFVHNQIVDLSAERSGAETPGVKELVTQVSTALPVIRVTDVPQRLLAAIVESSDDAIASKDLNGLVTSWNRSAEKLFGYAAEEIIGKPVTLIIPPELHQDEAMILGKIRRGEKIDHFETYRVRKNGERINVSLTISPIKDEQGRVLGAAKIIRDISESKRIEHALRTTEKLAAAGRLAATVAHEINNPLEAVVNYIYLAKVSPNLETVKGYLAGAEAELERVTQLTKQTLGFYRESKNPAAVRIGSLIEPLLAIFAAKIRNKAIRVSVEKRQDPEMVVVAGEIRQLLANLVSNSIDAIERDGLIRVRLSSTLAAVTSEAGVRLTVADSGVGIAPTDVPRLFEPFFTTKKDIGTGLGLWVCKSVVERHGGKVRIKSCTRSGRNGSTFSVFLPLGGPPQEE